MSIKRRTIMPSREVEERQKFQQQTVQGVRRAWHLLKPMSNLTSGDESARGCTSSVTV